MKQCFGYVRVSTAKQGEGVSLSEQREAIQRYADRHGLRLVRWFEERETAAKSGRPVFAEALRLLKRGQAEGLVIHKIDRSARNLRDWSDLVDFMDEGLIHFAHESLDLNTRGGRLAADIQAVVAADYIRNLSEETKKGHLGRLKQGLYPFPAPIGYLDTGRGNVKAVDPVMGPLVAEAFELYSTGEYSLARLAEAMHQRGLRTRFGKRVHKARLATILHQPFYTGLMYLKNSGETWIGKHEPLVSRILYDEVQDRMHGRTVKRKAKRSYLFRRLFRCAHCGRCLVGESQKGHVYYRCHAKRCPSRTVREDAIRDEVGSVLSRLRFAPDELSWLREAILSRQGRMVADAERTIQTLERDLAKTHSRITKLTTAWLDGDIDKPTYSTAKRGILTEQQSKTERLTALRQDRELGLAQAEEALELAASAQQTFEVGNDEEKRDLLRIVSSNRSLSENGLSVELAFPFSEMALSTCVPNGCPSRDDVRTTTDVADKRGTEKLEYILRELCAWVKASKSANYDQ